MSDPASSSDRRPSLFRRLARFLGADDDTQAIRESIEEVIEESERENAQLSPQERTMLTNLLRFGETRVGDVMVPRGDIVAVEENISLGDLITRFREAQHSRIPVYRDTLDDPIGVIHVKDVLGLIERAPDGTVRWPDVPIASLKRDIDVVPPSMPARDLLLLMQRSHSHLALVIDEYGGTDGLVSIEDLVEEIVGDIDDEHDTDDTPRAKPLPGGAFEAEARMSLEDFEEQTGIALKAPDPDAEVDTLGGLAVALMGRLPKRGEIVTDPSGFTFEILEADPRRVRRVKIKPPAKIEA
ncbi:MAG: HlyC/CorC family transporter [Proteobacteria bacterium]|nr:HlyC/CorC family transporter [Pseudomonadota bacterium]